MYNWVVDDYIINERLFVGNYDSFYGRNLLLSKDGVHFFRKGVAVSVVSLEQETCASLRFLCVWRL